MKRFLLSIIALLTFFSSVAYSFDFNRLDNVNIEDVKIKAQQGNAEAQCTLGSCFLSGKYVEKDVQKALEWLHKSAKQECSDAQTILGLLYYGNKCSGIKQDKEVGKYWIRRAVTNGCEYARSILTAIELIEKRKEERHHIIYD